MIKKLITTSITHIAELRKRLIQSISLTAIVFVLACYYSKEIFHGFVKPMIVHLDSQMLIATSVIAPFIVPLKLAFYLSLLLTMPYHFYQLWQFIKPGLYKVEKFYLRLFLGMGIVMFYVGVFFAYWVVIPLIFAFLTMFIPADVQLMPDIQIYLDFAISMFIVFGLIFEIPIVMMLLILLKVVNYESLVKLRPYMIVFFFILGMLLTPPDVISQILLALPMCGLYEAGLWCIRVLLKSNKFSMMTKPITK